MKKYILSALLIIGFCISLNAQTSKNLVATMSWEDGNQEIYLLAGTYHFEITANITTDEPFNDWTTWNNVAIVQEINYNYQNYGWPYFGPVTGVNFVDYTDTFSIYESGTYTIQAGAYEIGGCTVNSNIAKLIRNSLFQNQ